VLGSGSAPGWAVTTRPCRPRLAADPANVAEDTEEGSIRQFCHERLSYMPADEIAPHTTFAVMVDERLALSGRIPTLNAVRRGQRR